MGKDDFTVKIEDDRIMFMTSYRNEFGEECSVANIISKERLLEISNNINCVVAKLSKDDGNCNKPAVSKCVEPVEMDTLIDHYATKLLSCYTKSGIIEQLKHLISKVN